MKKFYTLAFIAAICTVAAKGQWVPPEFNESEWTYIGQGVYQPGVMDWSQSEVDHDLDAKVYASNTVEGDYWFETDNSDVITEDNDETGERTQMAPGPFIIHAADRNKVFVDPIWWLHPLIGFTFSQRVPEVVGLQKGNKDYYGTWDDFNVISFPPESFICGVDNSLSNKGGNFALYMPNADGVEGVTASDNSRTEFYNLQGVRVANPVHGQLYIAKKGSKTAKVIY